MIKFKKHLSLLFLLTFLTNITILKSNTYLKKITYGTAAGVLTYNITPVIAGVCFCDHFGPNTHLNVEETKKLWRSQPSFYDHYVPLRQELELFQYIFGVLAAFSTYKLTDLNKSI